MKNRKLSFRSNSAYGFSVVELIVALTIMTIIVTVGFSAYSYAQTNYGKIKTRLDDQLNANPEGKDVEFRRRFFEALINNESLPVECEPGLNRLKDCISNFAN